MSYRIIREEQATKTQRKKKEKKKIPAYSLSQLYETTMRKYPVTMSKIPNVNVTGTYQRTVRLPGDLLSISKHFISGQALILLVPRRDK